MREKPIIFSTNMVKAILDGRKTQTRRVIKPNTLEKFTNIFWRPQENVCFAPYRAGDILWVRETTYLYGKWVKNGTTKTGKQKWRFVWDRSYPVYYVESPPDDVKRLKTEIGYFKRPSIFMPKEAARIFLKVKSVRVERLQEITEEDARAEGCIETADSNGVVIISARGRFHALWDSLNAKRGYGWETSPWVWVIEFEVTKP